MSTPTTVSTQLKLPDWSRGRVLVGVRQLYTLSKKSLPTAYSHPSVLRHVSLMEKENLTGHDVLMHLARSYDKSKAGRIFTVNQDDLIHGCFGIEELFTLQEAWKELPAPFTVWANGKVFYGYRDVLKRSKSASAYSPCLNCKGEPVIEWVSLDEPVKKIDVSLRFPA